MQGDVFDPASWRSQLQGAVGVISTLGGFGSNDAMFKVAPVLRRTPEPFTSQLTRSRTSASAPGHANCMQRSCGGQSVSAYATVAPVAAAAAGNRVQQETASCCSVGHA